MDADGTIISGVSALEQTVPSAVPSAADTRREPSVAAPRHRVFYPALDGLRTIAFLMVFFHHYLHTNWGWAGVNIFFVLSGFLITGILFATQNRPNRFRTFYTRRVLRIFPLYYAVFAVLLLFTPLLHFHWNRFWLFWVFHLGNYLRDFQPVIFTGTFGWVPFGVLSTRWPWLFVNTGHFWSLCVEEQFYLVWPVVVFSVRRQRPLLVLCLAYFALTIPVRMWFVHAHVTPEMLNGWINWAMPLQADALLLGGALALWLHQASGARAVQSQARVSPVFAAAFLLIAVWLLRHHDFQIPLAGNLLTYPLVDLTSACVLFEALRPASFVAKLLSWRPLRQAGKFTYGAYVFHDLPHTLYVRVAQHLFRSASLGTQTRVATCIALMCTVILAWLSFTFFESRFLKLKQQWASE